MGIWPWKASAKIDPLTADQLLEHFGAALVEATGVEVAGMEKGEYHERQLAIFTLIGAGSTARRLLNLHPNNVLKCDLLFCESLLFYDCLWQLWLMGKYHSDAEREKVSYLAGWVDVSMRQILRAFVDAQPKAALIVRLIDEKKFRRSQLDAVRLYIHGDGPAYDEDTIVNNAIKFAMKLSRAAFGNTSESSVTAIMKEISQDLETLLRLRLLTQFDLSKCKVIVLTPDAYQ